MKWSMQILLHFSFLDVLRDLGLSSSLLWWCYSAAGNIFRGGWLNLALESGGLWGFGLEDSEASVCFVDLLLYQHQTINFSFALEMFESGLVFFICLSAKTGLRIPMDGEAWIFVISLFRTFRCKFEDKVKVMKVLYEFGFSGRAAWDWMLVWFGDSSDDAISSEERVSSCWVAGS